MKNSRYVWLIFITFLCLVGFVGWQTPQSVLTAMSNPQYSSSPEATVQKFWNLLDSRQIQLAKEMVEDLQKNDTWVQMKEWEEIVSNNPLISLQRIEYLENQEPNKIIVKVTWGSSLKDKIERIYTFKLSYNDKGWIINSFHLLK